MNQEAGGVERLYLFRLLVFPPARTMLGGWGAEGGGRGVGGALGEGVPTFDQSLTHFMTMWLRIVKDWRFVRVRYARRSGFFFLPPPPR